ncbi:MAG: toll/interleukin-1 receptor domain-containing protein [Anaerolineae bacterium]
MTSEPIEDLDPLFLDALTERLHGLPDIQARTERHQSWMTAEQIARWWSEEQGVHLQPEAIDSWLRARWLADPASSDIRPAKYPDRTTVCRLWGHVARVGKAPETELQLLRMDRPVELEALTLDPDAPLAFLSYAAPDLHFAARVRLTLAAWGIRAWMYSAELGHGSPIAEGVAAALSAAQQLIALATPLSLPSAWIDSEIHAALGSGKRATIAFDGSHPTLMKLLESWYPPQHYGERNFDGALLAPLIAEYGRYNSEARVAKYENNATEFLFMLTGGPAQVCVYPRRPAGWDGHAAIGDFEDTVRERLCT